MIKANIYKIYYQLVASRTQIQLLDANIARLKTMHDTKEIYKNGLQKTWMLTGYRYRCPMFNPKK
jgi:hypothetical protein